MCIGQEVVRNYAWFGRSVLPGMYNLTDAIGKYLFGDVGVPHYEIYRLVWVLYVGHLVVIGQEWYLEKFPEDLFVRRRSRHH